MKWAYVVFIWLSLMAVLWFSHPPIPEDTVWIPFAQAEAERSLVCDEKVAQTVHVTFGRITVINFPFKPKEVVPGMLNFDFKQIKNDLIIKAMKSQARTNLVVYLEDRRCSFDLVTVPTHGDDIVTVRDPKDKQIEVKFND